MTIVAALAALLGINAWTVLRFAQDKARAVAGSRRIAEADLLWLATLGGSPGAYLGRHMFRHKTKKQPFCDRLYLITIVQAAAVVGLVVYRLA